jgi:hypothetical protein
MAVVIYELNRYKNYYNIKLWNNVTIKTGERISAKFRKCKTFESKGITDMKSANMRSHGNKELR